MVQETGSPPAKSGVLFLPTGNDGKGGEAYANLQKKRTNSLGAADRYKDVHATGGITSKIWSAVSGKK